MGSIEACADAVAYLYIFNPAPHEFDSYISHS